MRSRHVLAFVCLSSILLFVPGVALSATTPCPQGDLGALPVTIGGVKIRPWSSANISSTTPATQESCVFLEAVGPTSSPLYVDHNLEVAGAVGPWNLVSHSSINISGGVSVTCSTTGNVARTAPTSGSLPMGSVTDICCFVWEAEPPGTCAELPADGDLVHHTLSSGGEADMPLFSYVPVGGTTCGLVGIEPLLLVLVLRRFHCRSRGGRSRRSRSRGGRS